VPVLDEHPFAFGLVHVGGAEGYSSPKINIKSQYQPNYRVGVKVCLFLPGLGGRCHR
jgi:hypothetical protein